VAFRLVNQLGNDVNILPAPNSDAACLSKRRAQLNADVCAFAHDGQNQPTVAFRAEGALHQTAIG
jgi:hypothetical protein